MSRLKTLKAKLIFFFVVNAISILLVFVFLSNEMMAGVFQRQIKESLAEGRNTVLQFVKTRKDRLQLGATLMAVDYGFKQAYSSEDLETINSALVNLRGRIQASFVSLVNLDGSIYASTVAHEPEAQGAIKALIAGYDVAADPAAWSAIRPWKGKLYQVVFVPFLTPDLVKWTAVGFEIDSELATSFKKISDSDVVFELREGGVRTPFASSLDESTTQAVNAELMRDSERPTLPVGEKRFAYSESQLDGNASILILRDTSAVTALMERAKVISLGLVFFLLAVSVLFSQFIARLISRPIQDITDKSMRLANGDLNVDLTTDLGDESLQELSRSLQRMTVALKNEISKKLAALHQVNLKQAQIIAVTGEMQKTLEKSAFLREIVAKAKEASNEEVFCNFVLDRVLKEFVFDRVAILGLAYSGRNLQALIVRTKDGLDPKFEKTKTMNTGLALDDMKIPELRYFFQHMPEEWVQALRDESYVYYENRASEDTFLAVPLLVKRRPQGFFHIIDNSMKKMSEDDIRVLCAIADILAPFVERGPQALSRQNAKTT